jgi:hypothetical protein
MTPRKTFQAEVLFMDPDGVSGAVAALAAHDCKFTRDPDAFDEHSDAVFGWVTGATELSEDELGDWLSDVISPHTGDVI